MVKSRYIGDGHPTFNRNPYNGYLNPYYWVDDHPLLYGNNGSLDPGTYINGISLQSRSLANLCLSGWLPSIHRPSVLQLTSQKAPVVAQWIGPPSVSPDEEGLGVICLQQAGNPSKNHVCSTSMTKDIPIKVTSKKTDMFKNRQWDVPLILWFWRFLVKICRG